MRINAIRFALGCVLAASLAGRAAETLNPLWQIGEPDHSGAEFALAPTNYGSFLQWFGSPDHAYYVGLSPASDWPYVLPGPLDGWGGSSGNGRWDQMNTLPIGFTLEQVPATGQCALIVDLCDTRLGKPPRLRVTVNGQPFDRDLEPGGSEKSLVGDWQAGKAQTVRVEFPVSLLRAGYNEIALRSTKGSWMVFDDLRFEAPAGTRLASPAGAVIRSVTAAPYAVSPGRKTPATIRIEVFRAWAGPGSSRWPSRTAARGNWKWG